MHHPIECSNGSGCNFLAIKFRRNAQLPYFYDGSGALFRLTGRRKLAGHVSISVQPLPMACSISSMIIRMKIDTMTDLRERPTAVSLSR